MRSPKRNRNHRYRKKGVLFEAKGSTGPYELIVIEACSWPNISSLRVQMNPITVLDRSYNSVSKSRTWKKKLKNKLFQIYFRLTSAPDETIFSLFLVELNELSILGRFRLTSGLLPVNLGSISVHFRSKYVHKGWKTLILMSRCTFIWSTWWRLKRSDWCRCLKISINYIS